MIPVKDVVLKCVRIKKKEQSKFIPLMKKMVKTFDSWPGRDGSLYWRVKAYHSSALDVPQAFMKQMDSKMLVWRNKPHYLQKDLI